MAQDFGEMKALGANVVRVHLQFGKFMEAPDRPNAASLARLEALVELAERTGLLIDVTGLGCYHKKDVPAWYDALSEDARWAAQARFWEAVAQTCAPSPAIFCYDLMNEPILPGDTPETDWLAGEFAGKHFVQRISLHLAGRTREQVARAWADRLVAAIRTYDADRLITVGEIPWVFVFGGGTPLDFGLDFVSVHFYPKKGEIDKALTALAAYRKPALIEETFPLECSMAEFEEFVRRSGAAGWIGFYWGKTLDECRRSGTLRDAFMADWLDFFRRNRPPGSD